LLRLIAASRILCYPSRLWQLWHLKFMDPYFLSQKRKDRFFFLTHDYYLSRFFTLAQRIDCAIAHYRYEGQTGTPVYLRAVYHSEPGLTLWRQVVRGVRCAIILRATEDNRYEGDLSVCCYVNDALVCRVSFSYVDCSSFGLPPQSTIFVTRNQTYLIPEVQLFRETFKQNSPPYFCVAAICGIAMANGMHAILMVKSDAQIAYAEEYADGFTNSYSALWKRLGAEEIGGQHAYSMPIPLPLAPLSAVRHRSRAIARRRNWMEITLSARRIMLEHRMSQAPPLAEAELGGSPMLWDELASENAAQNQTLAS
jgi:uncharacterized protein